LEDFVIKTIVRDRGFVPQRQHTDDAGADLYTPNSFSIGPQEIVEVDLMCGFEIPESHAGLIVPRSSMNKKQIHVYLGVIDSGYRGFVKVLLQNIGTEVKHFNLGDRIAQILIIPVLLQDFCKAPALSDTTRGSGGFGSTGR
jgi:dUTP pyrophosphatase